MDHELTDLKSAFPGNYRLSSIEKKQLWDAAAISFDANVLLNIYRYSRDTRGALIGITKKITGRLFLTHQAAMEFHANRIDTILEQAKQYDEVGKSISGIVAKLEADRRHPFISPRLHSEAMDLFSRVTGELEENGNQVKSLLAKDPNLDTITSIVGDRVMKPLAGEKMANLISEAKHRVDNKIPPGYCDANKDESRAPGDAIMWIQLLGWAKETARDMIFVTDDTKEDWWVRRSGITMGPRPELIEEFRRETGKKILIYQPGRFIEDASKYLNVKVAGEVVKEVKEVSRSRRKFKSSHTREPQFEHFNDKDRRLAEIIEHASIHKEELIEWVKAVDMIPIAQWKSASNLLELEPYFVSHIEDIFTRCDCLFRIIVDLHKIPHDYLKSHDVLKSHFGLSMIFLARHISQLPSQCIEVMRAIYRGSKASGPAGGLDRES